MEGGGSLPPRHGFRRSPLAWTCLALCLAGALLSAVNLDALPFWADEAGAVMPARSIHWNGLPSAYFDLDYMPWQIEHGLWDPATPLYRYALAAFTAPLGFSELTTRAFSLLAGLVAVIPLFALVRRIFGADTAWLTAAFLLTSASYMYFAREARHFTFVLLLVSATLCYAHAAAEGGSQRARALWFVCLVAALLAQSLAYAILPVIALYGLRVGPSRLFARRYVPVYASAAAVYLAILAVFWDTLPFFHAADCRSRPEGCQESPEYYLAVLYEFLRPMQIRHVKFPHGFFALEPLPLLVPLLFLAGLALTVRAALRARGAAGPLLILIWFLVPLGLLSAREVKFPRFLFQWVGPHCALFPAVAVAALARLAPTRRAQTSLAVALALCVVAAPQLARDAQGHWRLRSGLISFARDELFDPPADNFERMRWIVAQLEERVAPGDAIVTSHDDASLQFYLDRPVYGFLSSRRSDAYFVGLLERAEREGRRVWFVDTLPRHNYCLSDDAEPHWVDCREKYRRFYEACLSAAQGSACVRLPVPRWQR